MNLSTIHKFFIFCCILSSTHSPAQNPTIDSIKTRLETYPLRDSSYVISLNDLAYAYFSIDPDKTLNYSILALELANEIDYILGKGNAYTTKGIYYWAVGDNNAAVVAYLDALKFYDQVPYERGLVAVHINLGLVYRNQGLYQDALDSYLKALTLSEDIEYEWGIESASLNAGVTYFDDFYDYENGLKYLLIAQQYLRGQDHRRGLGDNYNNLGEVYYHLDEYDLAKTYFDSAWVALKGLNDQRGMATCYRNWAMLDFELGRKSQAIQKLKQAVGIASEAKLNTLLIDSYSRLGRVLYANDDFQESAHYRGLYMELNDSLRTAKNDRQITFLKTRFETEQKEKEISQQRLEIAERDIQILQSEKEFSFLLYLVYGITGVVIVSGLITFFVIRQNNLKKSKEILDAQIKTLKNQLSPHFLFNSLNTLSVILKKDNELADQCLHALADTYKYILQTFNLEVVELKEEVGLISSYLQMMKFRYGDSFELSIDLPEENDYLIPPLSLQLLVENAFKHNKISQDQPLKIKIFEEDGHVIVQNNIQEQSLRNEESMNLGLDIIRKRYKIMTDAALEIIHTSNEFLVKLPLLKIAR